MSQVCTEHPDQPASYQCDGCGKLLCESCIQESHVLLLCRHCGERALPLDGGQPASVGDLRRLRSISKPYSFGEAMTYPFRGAGPIMLVLVVLGSAGLSFAVFMIGETLFAGCYWLVLSLFLAVFYWGMVIGLQFKIARTTAEGETELPDWPDFLDVFSLVQDILTWVIIHLVPVALVGAMIYFRESFFREPSLFLWLLATAILWLGGGLAAMAYGAVGSYGRMFAFAFHHHLRAWYAGGRDALLVTNLVFGLGAFALVLQTVFSGIPILGVLLSGAIGGYWLFLQPHLAGLIFRRHSATMDQIYLTGVV